jgi:Ca2+-binding RTX toxin-like protein
MPYNPRTDEILVNFATAGNQRDPNVTRLSNGELIAVWSSPTTAQADQHAIVAQRFDAEGNKIGNLFFLTQITLRLQDQPDVAALPGGGFALTWNWFTSMGSQIMVKMFDAAGNPTSGEFFLDFGTTGTVGNSEIVGLSNGSAVVVWDDFGGGELSGAIVAPNGAIQTFQIATTVTGVQDSPSVAALTGGNFVVTWTDGSGLGGDADGGIKGQIFDAAGAKVGGEFLVNTTTAGSQGGSNVAALPSGGFVVLWDDGGQIFDPSGNKVGGEFPVTIVGEISVRSDGGFISSQMGADGDANGIYAQQHAADGSLIGGPFLVNSVTSGDQRDPALVTLANDDLFIVWEDGSGIGGDSDGSGVKARIFTSATLGTEGDDTFVGTPGDDEFRGFGGNDTFLLQQGGNDVADGGAGQDLFYFGAAFTAADSVDGGTGNDFLVLQGVYPNLVLTADTLVNVEHIVFWTFGNNGQGGATGTPNRFQITSVDATIAAGSVLTVDARQLGNNEPVIFNGAAETDGRFFFYGGAGNDYFTGGAGSDSFDGGTGTDTYTGGGGNDVYFVDHPADVVIEAVGGGGFDAVYSKVNYVLRAGSEVELLAINGLFSSQPMTLTGNELVQSIVGATGNDSLNGLGGNDFLTGNAGNDVLNGGTGADVMAGGVGNDVYFVDQAGDSIQEAVGAGSDAVYVTGDYVLQGGAEVELLAVTGAAASVGVILHGNEFGQSIVGGSGGDALVGGGGNDLITGNDGADMIDGGAGNDGLRGGAGADFFRFLSASDSSGAGDSIYDFVSGTDKINLSLIDADTGVAGDQAFTFIGAGAFTNSAGQLRAELSDGVMHIFGDINGDSVADLHILLYNAPSVNAGDFVL